MLLPFEICWIGSSTLLGERLRRVFVVVEGRTGRGAETPSAEKRTSVGRDADAEHELWEEKRSAGLAVGQVERKQDEGGMARGWAERETLVARGPVDPRNCQTVQEFQGHVRVVFVAAQ